MQMLQSNLYIDPIPFNVLLGLHPHFDHSLQFPLTNSIFQFNVTHRTVRGSIRNWQMHAFVWKNEIIIIIYYDAPINMLSCENMCTNHICSVYHGTEFIYPFQCTKFQWVILNRKKLISLRRSADMKKIKWNQSMCHSKLTIENILTVCLNCVSVHISIIVYDFDYL